MDEDKTFDVKKLINDRKKVHGNFEGFAPIYYELMTVIRQHNEYNNLDAVQAVAIDMILNKICRIINGNASFLDHWRDINGYSNLGGRL